MARKAATKTTLFDVALVATMIGFLAVLVNKPAFDPPVHNALLLILLLTASALGWRREALKERQLDELELAGASFGARWSMAVVGTIAMLLVFVAPLQDAIVMFAEAYEDNDGRPLPAPVGVFVVGFVFAIFVQLSAKSAIGAIWMWTKR